MEYAGLREGEVSTGVSDHLDYFIVSELTDFLSNRPLSLPLLSTEELFSEQIRELRLVLMLQIE
jgi:hypothetical protein